MNISRSQGVRMVGPGHAVIIIRKWRMFLFNIPSVCDFSTRWHGVFQFIVTRREIQIQSPCNRTGTIYHARIQRGGEGIRTPTPLKNKKNIGFLSNTGPDPLKNHKATKPAFNVGPSSARQRNAI